MDDPDRAMRAYYERRAPLLDAAYREGGASPDWVVAMVADMQAALRGRRVLEVACGTGHWTALAARAAEHTLGTDTSPAILALARGQGLAPARCGFQLADAYALDAVPGRFDGGLAMQ